MKTTFSRGITLVELMVVLLVLGVIAAVAAPSFADMLERRRVQAVAADISADLAFTRQEAQMRSNTLYMQFQQGSGFSCYTIYVWGGVGTCNCTLTGNACPAPNTNVEVKTVRLPMSKNVSFFPQNFTPSARVPYPLVSIIKPKMAFSPTNFFVTVSGSRGATLNVGLLDSADNNSRIVVCTPNHSVSGAPPCP